jgi:hypothetical protein
MILAWMAIAIGVAVIGAGDCVNQAWKWVSVDTIAGLLWIGVLMNRMAKEVGGVR